MVSKGTFIEYHFCETRCNVCSVKHVLIYDLLVMKAIAEHDCNEVERDMEISPCMESPS